MTPKTREIEEDKRATSSQNRQSRPDETPRREELFARIRNESRTALAKHRIFRLGIGLVLLALGTVSLFVLSVPSIDLPGYSAASQRYCWRSGRLYLAPRPAVDQYDVSQSRRMHD
jgi:hypothetical protein